ncbi:MAG: OmpA family protein, partial [Chitinophagaceae bacterium]
LYFNSSGLPGYGSTDLFVARKNGNEWEKPQNLGYPINTIDDEGSLIVSADGRTGYFASDRVDTKGGLDLYQFELPANVRASKTTWVKGKVYDKKTMQGLPSRVVLTDLDTRNVVSRLQTDEEGNYFVALPTEKNYAFNVGRKGYLFYSENYSVSQSQPDSPQVVNIPLQPIEAGAAIILKNIFFDVGKSELREESLTELNLVIALMNENPGIKVRISGHTDNVGKPADNLALSRERARSVVKYLSDNGINATRLSAEGFGETKPVESNATEEGKSRNRRTEMQVVSH